MEIVQTLRRKKGWSQEHLAQAAEISRATLQRLEAGKVLPSNEVAQALARALGCDASRIREDSLLVLRVRKAMARILEGGRPTPTLLERLPKEYRDTLAEHCDARDEALAAHAAVTHATELYAAAGKRRELWMSRNLIAVLSGQNPQNELEDIGNEQQSAFDALLTSSERQRAALARFGSTGTYVSALLIRLCV